MRPCVSTLHACARCFSVSSLVGVFLVTEWVCRWKPFWIPVGNTFQKAYLEEWQLVDDGSIRDHGENSTETVPCVSDSWMLWKAENKDGTVKHEQPLDTASAPKSSWQAVGEPDAPTGKLSGTLGTSVFWEKSEAPLPHPKRSCHFIHPKQLSPFPERLELPFPDEEILSGYEEDMSFIRYGFTWVKACSNTTLEQHVVNVRKALAEYREGSVGRHDTSAQKYYFDSSVPNRSSLQKRPSIYNWNPGPRRKERAPLRSKSQASGTSSHCRKRLSTIPAIIITCSPFFSQELISDYSYSRDGGRRIIFQLQLQPRSRHGIIFQFRLQPRSRYGKTVSNDNIR